MAVDSYSARHLTVLEGLEAVRKRPGMYIGSTDSRGLLHCIWELIDNSVDEALGGYATEILVSIQDDGSIEVSDNGRGIPVDSEAKTGLSGVELVFTKLHAGGKFGGGGYSVSGGLHGVGASVVNALSRRLDVAVKRGGKSYSMSFRRGEPGVFAGLGVEASFAPFVEQSELVVKKAAGKDSGTTVRFWPDPEIFQSLDFPLDAVRERLRQTSFLIPGLALTLQAKSESETFLAREGLLEMIRQMTGELALTAVQRFSGQEHFEEQVPVLESNGSLANQMMKRTCQIDIALAWSQDYETEVRSFVNVINTPGGGTHLAGFEQGILKAFRLHLESQSRKFKLGNLRVDRDDIFAGLRAAVAVRLAEPQFEGQTKSVLGSPQVKNLVATLTQHQVAAWLAKGGKSRLETDALLERIVGEAKARESARSLRTLQRRKAALENSNLPAKLVDCRASSPETELFIVEGDSALGTAKLARDSNFQALLPIRGKILNVQRTSAADMLSNAECSAIIQVLGGGSGRSFTLDNLRYGRVILMSDADVDGAHIRTLLLTLFFRHMRPLVEAGRVFAAVPPLHRVQYQKGRERVVRYTYSQAELAELLLELQGQQIEPHHPIQRYKGLGEMDADQLAETTMSRERRTLRRINVADAELASKMFELLMGGEVNPRKEFIMGAAESVERERIDS